jgi:hypothetical protein
MANRTKLLKHLLLLLLVSAGASAQTFKEVDYLYRANEEAKPKHLLGKVNFDAHARMVTFVSDRHARKDKNSPFLKFSIPSSEVTSALYERTARPRIAEGLLIAWPLMFTKEKKHYLTIQYKSDAVGKFAIFQFDKTKYREALAATEAALGVKVERTEER